MSDLIPVDESIKHKNDDQDSDDKSLTKELFILDKKINPNNMEIFEDELELSQRNFLYWRKGDSKVSPRLID